MYNDPSDLPLLTNPVGIDAPIQELQVDLKTNIPWLQKSFGRAYIGRTIRSAGKLYQYPAIYSGNSEVYDASPNDNLTAYSFFEIEGSYRAQDYENSGDSGTNNYESPVSLVVWGNLNKVNESLDTPYTDQNFSQNLLQEILIQVRKNYDFKVVSIEDNLYNVFEPYTCRTDDPTMFYFPYFCFKIRMTGVWREECGVTTISPPPVYQTNNTLQPTLQFTI